MKMPLSERGNGRYDVIVVGPLRHWRVAGRGGLRRPWPRLRRRGTRGPFGATHDQTEDSPPRCLHSAFSDMQRFVTASRSLSGTERELAAGLAQSGFAGADDGLDPVSGLQACDPGLWPLRKRAQNGRGSPHRSAVR